MAGQFAAFRASMEKHCDDAIAALIGYALLAAGAVHLTSDGSNPATIWPADALILALLLKNDRRHWPAILIAGWAGNLLANAVCRGWSPGLTVYGVINMGQAVIAAWLIENSKKAHQQLNDERPTIRFILAVGVIAPLCGAIAGSAATTLNYGEPFGPSFVRWFVSNSLGLLIVTPFVITILDGSCMRAFRTTTTGWKFEALGMHGLHISMTAAVFACASMPLLFLPVATLLLLSFKMGRLGTIVGVVMIAVVGMGATLKGSGPVSAMQGAPGTKEVFVQIYVLVLFAMTMPVARAVTSQKKALKHLAESREALRLMMARSPGTVLSFDAAGKCRTVDGPTMACLGIEPAAMIGRSLDVLDLRARDLAEKLVAAGPRETQPPVVFEFSPLLRPQLALEASMGVVWRDGAPDGSVVILREVKKRQVANAATLATYQFDGLTGLPNSLGFRQHLNAAIKEGAGSTALALIEVDGFAGINNNHGPAMGAAVLVEIARRMKRVTRSQDLVARIGTSEFAILLPGDVASARTVCERVIDAIRDGPVLSDGSVHILASVSCGLAEHRPGASPDAVIGVAESALQEAKKSGRNGLRMTA